MENVTEIKILCVATKTWYNKYLKKITSPHYIYNVQFTSLKVDQIKKRLTHNSYDILIVDYSFIEKHVKQDDCLVFNKLAYAMSRPSILVYNNFISYLKMKFFMLPTAWLEKFKTSKKLITISQASDLASQISLINSSKKYHSYIDQISSEIYNIFINQ